MGAAFGIQLNNCGEAIDADIVNVLRPLAIFAEELHRVSLTRYLIGF